MRTLVVGVLSYVGLVLFRRISGKRTLSKLNAIDLVVTVALGSTLASILVNKSVSLVQGLLAFALLITLQFVVTWLSVRQKRVRQFVTGEPTLLVRKGEMLQKALRRERVTHDEIHAAVRESGLSGLAGLAGVEAVVLETDGTLSVVNQGRQTGSMEPVQKPTI